MTLQMARGSALASSAAEMGGGDGNNLERLARQLHLSVNDPIFQNRSLTVEHFVSQFRKATIWQVLGWEYADMTVEEAGKPGGATARKQLVNKCFFPLTRKQS